MKIVFTFNESRALLSTLERKSVPVLARRFPFLEMASCASCWLSLRCILAGTSEGEGGGRRAFGERSAVLLRRLIEGVRERFGSRSSSSSSSLAT